MTPLLELIAFTGLFCGALCLAGLIGMCVEKREAIKEWFWSLLERPFFWIMAHLEEQPTDPPWVEWPEKDGWEDYT